MQGLAIIFFGLKPFTISFEATICDEIDSPWMKEGIKSLNEKSCTTEINFVKYSIDVYWINKNLSQAT